MNSFTPARLDHRGDPLELAIVGAYSLQDFMQLMRTAQPIGGRKLNENMSWVANAPFTDDEIEGLYAFLREFHGFNI